MKIVFVDSMSLPPYDCDTPYTRGIGGTQSAICYYAEALAKEHDVTVVICNAKEASQVRGVQFKPMSWFYAGIKAEVLIWCSGIPKDTGKILKQSVRADLSIAWIPHNTNEAGVDFLGEHLYSFDIFAFVSTWQQKKFIEEFDIPLAKTMLMLNGISPAFQGPFDPAEKKPRFVYLSQPDRGLSVLAEAWPRVVKACPTAELHTYAGRKLYGGEDNASVVALFDTLRAMTNVHVHEPIGQAELVEKCREAAFFAYPTNFYETGCIALTEAMAAGCLPIVSDLGALGTYFDDCLKYGDTLVDQFVERAQRDMTFFMEERDAYNAETLRYSTKFQTDRDYRTLASRFVKEADEFLIYKYKAVQTFAVAEKYFASNNNLETRLHLEKMPLFFEKPENVFNHFLMLGVAHYHGQSPASAFRYFTEAAKWGDTQQLCVNQILTCEKLGKEKDLLYWCEKSLTHQFNMAIIHKILNLVQKKPYFERCKWGKYLLSLWNDDINNTEWMSIFLAHGNMVVGDYCMVMHHEEGIKQLADIITKALAFIELHKIDLKVPSVTRNNLEKLFSNLFLNLNYYEINNKEHFRNIQYFIKHMPPLISAQKSLFSKIPPNRKLRIGFMSGDLVYHPVSYILNGIVEHFDKSRFDVCLFSTTEKKLDNSLQNKLRKEATEFIDLHGQSITAIIDAIKINDIDLLIEMTGHTTTGTDLLNVVRAKPARVIAQYFAYPNTYGIPEIDYKIGDKYVFPTGLDSYYVEKFCVLKGGMHTYKPVVELSVNKMAHEGIVFGCTNNPKKYRPAWIKCVATILKRVPGSKYKARYYNLNDPSIQEFYYKEFEKHGVDRKRIDLGLGETLEKYFSCYADMDICLDPFPYNGGTINIEILYAGLPYITLLGNSYVSRVGASILHQIGHPELIAKTEEAYVEYAVALAGDKGRLDAYKATIRDDMMKSTLGDNKAFTREFEKGCEWMIREKKWLSTNTLNTLNTPNTLTYA